MNEPSGPLPPSVYWRRRALAVGGTALVVLLFIWAVAALLGGNDPPSVQGTANVRAGGGPLRSGPPSSDPPSSDPPSMSAGRPSGSATTAPSSAGQAAAASPAPTTTSAPPPPPPGPPPVCGDDVIKLTAIPGRPDYRVGQRPVLTLQVTNIGPIACTRDLSHQFRALSVVALSAPTVPLWTSDDCYQASTHEIHTLGPGQSVFYGVTWAGRTSAPGCPAGRTVVPAGQYGVIAKLGPLASAPVPFTLTP